MIGIYKITNKINNKSYIGQSIHCGKRLDEHCKGSQFIDEIIQLEGIENFTFEILKEVLRNELSYWEDYYIIKYQTYFPDGYNKKWNCNLEIRKEIKKQVENEIFQEKQINNDNNKQFTEISMPKIEEDIYNNSMKLYAYLATMATLTTYPDNTRMFRQKDLMFTQIKKATGITNDTVKLYLYYLEENGLIEYRGKIKFNFVFRLDENGKEKPAAKYRKERMAEAKEKYELRYKKEKDGVYLIPRPTPFIPVPEQTLEKLNNFFECSELEMKLYLFCCGYHNDCEWKNSKYKSISFELIRDGMKVKDTSSSANRQIRCALIFLKAIGLIDFSEGTTINRKNAEIPAFKLKNVRYYIDYKIEDFIEEDSISREEFDEILKRISKENKI